MSKQTLLEEQMGKKMDNFVSSIFVFVATFYKELNREWRENKSHN